MKQKIKYAQNHIISMTYVWLEGRGNRWYVIVLASHDGRIKLLVIKCATERSDNWNMRPLAVRVGNSNKYISKYISNYILDKYTKMSCGKYNLWHFMVDTLLMLFCSLNTISWCRINLKDYKIYIYKKDKNTNFFFTFFGF